VDDALTRFALSAPRDNQRPIVAVDRAQLHLRMHAAAVLDRRRHDVTHRARQRSTADPPFAVRSDVKERAHFAWHRSAAALVTCIANVYDEHAFDTVVPFRRA
jgi:hypothetical protein